MTQQVYAQAVLLKNTEHELSFKYPKWNNNNAPVTATYKYERDKEGKMAYTKNDNVQEYPPDHPLFYYESCLFIVYDDEGVFGSGGLFKDPSIIKLVGFKAAVKELGYDKKWSKYYPK